MDMYEDMQSMSGLNLPPHSQQAEQAVLGGLMIDSRLIDEVSEIIQTSDFFAPKHRIIYEAIHKVYASGDGIDLVTVCEAISDLDDIGGIAYVAEIAMNTPGAANTKGYAKAVKLKAQERAIISAGNAIAGYGYDKDMGIDEKIASAQQSVMAIGETVEEAELTNNEILKQWVENLDDRFRNGNSFGLSTGFKDLDAWLNGFKAPNLIVLAARPGMGKSSIAFQMAAHAALREEVPTLIFSLEMSRDEIYDKMISCVGGINFDRVLKGTLEEDDWPKLSSVVQLMKDKPLHIDDRGGLHINQVLSAARRVNRKAKLGLIVVDYLQLIRGDGANRTAEVGQISRSLKALAKELHCPVIALSQLSRKVEERPNKRPMNSDLRDSGEIEQDADIIMFIYRDEVYNENSTHKGVAEIIVSKFRNGRLGTTYLSSQLDYSKFENMAHAYNPPPDEPKQKKKFDYQG
jgi:replicative DNA helicase